VDACVPLAKAKILSSFVQVAAIPCSATSCRLRMSYSVEFVKSCIFKVTACVAPDSTAAVPDKQHTGL
jgi:hypothetical protein